MHIFWCHQPSDACQLVFDDCERFFVAVFRRLLTAVDFLEEVLTEDPLASGSDSAEESDPASESESTSARFFRGGATCMIRQLFVCGPANKEVFRVHSIHSFNVTVDPEQIFDPTGSDTKSHKSDLSVYFL